MQSAAGLDSNNLQMSLLLSIAYLVNRPGGMLSDQWLLVGCRAFERWKIGRITHIAERDTNIA